MTIIIRISRGWGGNRISRRATGFQGNRVSRGGGAIGFQRGQKPHPTPFLNATLDVSINVHACDICMGICRVMVLELMEGLSLNFCFANSLVAPVHVSLCVLIVLLLEWCVCVHTSCGCM